MMDFDAAVDESGEEPDGPFAGLDHFDMLGGQFKLFAKRAL